MLVTCGIEVIYSKPLRSGTTQLYLCQINTAAVAANYYAF